MAQSSIYGLYSSSCKFQHLKFFLRLKFGNGFYLTLVKEDEEENGGEVKSPQPPQIEEELEGEVRLS